MKILECCYRVLWITKIPNIKTWSSIIIICDNKLSWNKWVPHYLCLFHVDLFTIALRVITSVEVVVVVHTLRLFRFCKLEDGFALFEVPYHYFAIFRGTCQNMRYYPIPTNRCDTVSFMKIGLARFEFSRLLKLTDVLNENFTATTCK
jgi:hypothetical protein